MTSRSSHMAWVYTIRAAHVMSEENGQKTCCDICGSLDFELSDGLFFCLDCGTQSQDVREEITEEGTESASFVRTLKAPSTKKKDNPNVKKVKDVTLLEKMQVILQLQCDALIKLGYDRSIKEMVKYLWFLYLKRFRYAFVDDADTPISSQPADLTVATPTRPLTPITPAIAPPTPTLATPSLMDIQTPRSRGRKRHRSEFDDNTEVFAPKKSRKDKKCKPLVDEDLQLEESLFESSQGLLEEGEREDDNTVMASPKKSRKDRSSKKKGKGKLFPVHEDPQVDKSLLDFSQGLLGEEDTTVVASPKKSKKKRKLHENLQLEESLLESSLSLLGEGKEDETVMASASPKKSRKDRSSKKKGKGKIPLVCGDLQLEESLFEPSQDLLEEGEREDDNTVMACPRTDRSSKKKDKGKLLSVHEDLQLDESLLEFLLEPPPTPANQDKQVTPPPDPALQATGNELYLLNRAKQRQKTNYFTIRFTAGLLYLGLLYTGEKILLADLTRLFALNKVPYHNLHTVLPSYFITAQHSTSLYARRQVTSDKIHYLSQSLYKAISKTTAIPELPLPDPQWVCHTLLDRLQLPPSFHTMLDRALTSLYWPDGQRCFEHWPEGQRCSDHYQNTDSWRGQRLDLQCMALIICVVKMVYRLDDVYEFESPSSPTYDQPMEENGCVAGQVTGSGSAEEGYVYMWEDWVTIFCRHMQRTLDQGVPLNARELEYVSDYQNFLDFCRLEVFPNVRPRDKPWVMQNKRFRPEYYKQVSRVFHQHLLNLREREKSEGGGADASCSRKEEAEPYSWDDFVPRRIPLSALLRDLDCAPWRKYLATPMTSDDPQADFRRLPNSVVLLLQLCSDVVDTPPLALMQYLRNVEWRVIQGPLSSLIPTYSETI